MDIENWRDRIDEVDLKILHYLNERAKYSIEIAQIKKQERLPIYSPQREAWIMERLMSENAGPLSHDGVRRVFERIIDESRKLEKDVLAKQTNNEKSE
jgi:chorismate mutase